MKNSKKLKRGTLKTIKGGYIPMGCIEWDGRNRCCRSWELDYCNNPSCPDAPPSFCN
ncbi:hypothetical protein [Chryseobacterium sp. Marseille-Q3244]|uniref:bacteriocin-like protein n=1 Tax=Chryseobacterium sp. Marseille-Q3244 TaxID=2758092 RepID=UPI002024B407|nr:hypothetical protein [Chryseobacterium sp. Marseille-Q3244]